MYEDNNTSLQVNLQQHEQVRSVESVFLFAWKKKPETEKVFVPLSLGTSSDGADILSFDALFISYRAAHLRPAETQCLALRHFRKAIKGLFHFLSF